METSQLNCYWPISIWCNGGKRCQVHIEKTVAKIKWLLSISDETGTILLLVPYEGLSIHLLSSYHMHHNLLVLYYKNITISTHFSWKKLNFFPARNTWEQGNVSLTRWKGYSGCGSNSSWFTNIIYVSSIIHWVKNRSLLKRILFVKIIPLVYGIFSFDHLKYFYTEGNKNL